MDIILLKNADNFIRNSHNRITIFAASDAIFVGVLITHYHRQTRG